MGSLSLFMDCSHNGGSANDTVIKCACGECCRSGCSFITVTFFLISCLLLPLQFICLLCDILTLTWNKRAKHLRIFLFSWDLMYSLAILIFHRFIIMPLLSVISHPLPITLACFWASLTAQTYMVYFKMKEKELLVYKMYYEWIWSKSAHN